MQAQLPHLLLRVTASSSNLGPGFDLLGLALSLHLKVEARPLPSASEHQVLRRGALHDELATAGKDLTVFAFETVAKRHGIESYYCFTQSSEIPIGRGLGSSGAAIAAGLLLAQAACPHPIEMKELMRIGIEIEGHPDNVVASLLGGLTLCQAAEAGASPTLMQPPLHPSIGFSVVWPGTQLATKDSRSVLPEQVPFTHAVDNPCRLAFLLEGLRSGSPKLLKAGERDNLHVPYRLPLIPGSKEALAAAREAGAWLATISGSGSALIALGPKDRIKAISRAMGKKLAETNDGVEARVLEPVFGSPQVERLGGR